LIFLAAGTLHWSMGWWYYAISVSATLLSRLLALRVSPDLLVERGSSTSAANIKSWDRILSSMVGLVVPVVMLFVIGLDHRFSWSPPLPAWVAPSSLIVLVLGYLLSTWAFLVNRFFSSVVRIQSERGHTVIMDGPYRWLRHPGYLGGLFAIIATPLMLGSLWAFIPCAIYIVLLVTRTALEDRTLQEELPGYREYAQQTRYRLLPGVW
ncbi:MAG: isoprenylcysteine carboxylmethyltransferase family protein, partial [Anaerolineales bacterium]|nr:isoprenylcysteine carboxylmethyltransferase family protein [Anaerolineales bacterium]